MARATIFHDPIDKATTIADEWGFDHTRVSQTSAESRDARLPGERRNPSMQVRNVIRPRRGHGY